jgi:hypothetical protein
LGTFKLGVRHLADEVQGEDPEGASLTTGVQFNTPSVDYTESAFWLASSPCLIWVVVVIKNHWLICI